MKIKFFISGERRILSKEFLCSAVFIAPLFQVYGYWSRMGINDKSIAYIFFYAVPLVLLMLIVIGLNTYIVRKNYNYAAGKKIIASLKWIGAFALLYIFLLPVGGYRPYRPEIIRYDTIMPVTIVLIYFWGASTYFLINHLKGGGRIKYVIAIVICLLIYIVSDTAGLDKNECERQTLNIIANSNDSIVRIPGDCHVMSWKDMTDYRQSEQKAELLYRWKITNEKKLFYSDPDVK